MGLFNFWKKNSKTEEDGTYWVRTNYRNKETGEYTDKWRMESLAYGKFHKGEKPSRIKLYADGELVFDGKFKELTDIVKEHNNKVK
jgi:hypothetical protein